MSTDNENTNNTERKLYVIKSTTNNQEPSLSIVDLDGDWDTVKGCYVSPENGREVFCMEWVLKGANRRFQISLHYRRDQSVSVVWSKKRQAIQSLLLV